jgi:hypothetical protein
MALRHGGQSSGSPVHRAEGEGANEGACSLRISTRDETLVLTLGGRLDAVAGRLILDAVEGAVGSTRKQVELDVGEVGSFSTDGAAALAACRHRLDGRFPGGLHYRAGTASGHQVLLAAASQSTRILEDAGGLPARASTTAPS